MGEAGVYLKLKRGRPEKITARAMLVVVNLSVGVDPFFLGIYL